MGGEKVRLYVKGSFVGFKGGKRTQYSHTSLVRIQGCNSKEEAKWYLGKRLAYVYKAKTLKQGTRFRCIFGKVTRTHGSVGVVRAKFAHNLPAEAMGARIRVMLYPSSI